VKYSRIFANIKTSYERYNSVSFLDQFPQQSKIQLNLVYMSHVQSFTIQCSARYRSEWVLDYSSYRVLRSPRRWCIDADQSHEGNYEMRSHDYWDKNTRSWQ